MLGAKIILTIGLALAALTASAQANFLDNLRKTEDGKGRVVVQQSKQIDSLVNNISAPVAPQPKGNPSDADRTDNPATAPLPYDKGNYPPSPSTHAMPTTGDDAPVTTPVDTRKKVMRKSYKTTGYRIQVFSGGNSRTDRQKAESAGNSIKQHFPFEPVYVHFYSPSWKCRMGNYRDLAEARRILSQVKSLGFTQACIVKGTISVQY